MGAKGEGATMRVAMRREAAAAASFFLAWALLVARTVAQGVDVGVERIPTDAIEATVVERRFGDDIAMRGAVLRARGGDGARHFGGWSGLVAAPSPSGSDDRIAITAVSDLGWWLKASILMGEDAEPRSVTNATVGPLLGLSGGPVAQEGKIMSDAESVVRLHPSAPDDALLVSFERVHRVWKYPSGLTAAASTDAALDAVSEAIASRCAFNDGAEGIAVLLPGPSDTPTLLAFCEGHLPGDPPDLVRGWLAPLASAPTAATASPPPQPVYVSVTDGFKITDLAVLGSGTVVMLQR